MYFTFTSLSTVGFGDYNPKSNFERLITAFFLLFGVAIFSYIMGEFISILESFNEINDDINYGDSLATFFGILKKFNRNEDFNYKVKQ